MIAQIPATQPRGAAFWQKATRFMDVILHIGAHRCATTSFQQYMRRNAESLGRAGIGFWGPIRTRSGLFRGLLPGPCGKRGTQARAMARVRMRCAETADQGVTQLVVSDENMLGTMRGNLRLADLYSGSRARVARFADAFSGYLTDILINIRSPEAYWTSAFGYLAEQGYGVPNPDQIARIADSDHGWRDVICDVAHAAPSARVHVLPFEDFAGRADAQLTAVTGRSAPKHAANERHNETPQLPGLQACVDGSRYAGLQGTGRWMPFSPAQQASLQKRYADDLMWLTAGADGLARLAEDPTHNKAGTHLPTPHMTEGRYDERRHRQVARAGRS